MGFNSGFKGLIYNRQGYDSICSFEIGAFDIGDQEVYSILEYDTVESGGNDLCLEEAYCRHLLLTAC